MTSPLKNHVVIMFTAISWGESFSASEEKSQFLELEGAERRGKKTLGLRERERVTMRHCRNQRA